MPDDPNSAKPEAPAADVVTSPAASDTTQDKFTTLPKNLSAKVGALQLTVIFAATGFIGKVALQEFLGIDLGNWSASDLTLFAGHWAFGTLAAVLNQIAWHPFVFGLPFALYVLVMLSPYGMPGDFPHRRLATKGAIALTAGALLLVLVTLEMPTLSINNWLTQPLAAQLIPNTTGALNSMRADLQATLLASKLEGVDPAHIAQSLCFAPTNDHDTKSSQQQQLDLLSKAIVYDDSHKSPQSSAQDELNRNYAGAVIVCVLAWFTLYFHASLDTSSVADELFRALRLGLMLVALPVVTALLPYMYAKLIYQTTFPMVTVTFKAESGLEDAASVLVVDETDKTISFLTLPRGQQTPSVQIIDRSDVIKMDRTGAEDVINSILVNCSTGPINNPATNPTSPSPQSGGAQAGKPQSKGRNGGPK